MMIALFITLLIMLYAFLPCIFMLVMDPENGYHVMFFTIFYMAWLTFWPVFLTLNGTLQ